MEAIGIGVKEIIVFAALIFNLGLTVAMFKNHIAHNKDAIKDLKITMDEGFKENKKNTDELFSKVNGNTTAIAKIEGRMNNKS